MKQVQHSWVLVAVMAVTGLSHAAGDPQRGQSIVMQGAGNGAPCLACHGIDGAGNDAAGFPRLAGMNAGYLVKQMRDYRSGVRQSTVMRPNVDGLEDQQIEDVAAWYASQKAPSAQRPEVSAERLALGEKLATRGDWDNYIVPCETCHGPGSQGVGPGFPGLAGQHPTYLRQQLQAWKEGSRSNDPDQLMLAIASRLSDEQIEAVAAYLARQPQQGGH